MATAEKYSLERTRMIEETVSEERVILDLSKEEAEFLTVVLSLVAGSVRTYPRKHQQDISAALYATGGHWKESRYYNHVSGILSCKDYPTEEPSPGSHYTYKGVTYDLTKQYKDAVNGLTWDLAWVEHDGEKVVRGTCTGKDPNYTNVTLEYLADSYGPLTEVDVEVYKGRTYRLDKKYRDLGGYTWTFKRIDGVVRGDFDTDCITEDDSALEDIVDSEGTLTEV